jgi:hypothetical protein
MAGPARPSSNPPRKSGERGPVRSFPLSAGVGGDPPSTLLFDILSMTSWLDCMIRALSISAWETDVASLLYADDANALSFTNGLQS